MPRLLAGIFLSLAMASAAHAGEPCCGVVSVDARAGVVHAQDNATKRRFDIKVDNPVMLARIRAGQSVDADFKTNRATIATVSGQFAIVGSAPTVAASPQLATAPQPKPATITPAKPAAPAPTAAITPAKPATPTPTLAIPGSKPAAQAPSAAIPPSKPNVALGGGSAAAPPAIVGGTPPPTIGGSSSAAGKVPSNDASPCCAVAAIDTGAKIVRLQENAGARSFNVKVDNPLVLSRVRVGQKADVDEATNQASIEGINGRFAIAGTEGVKTAQAPSGPLGAPPGLKQPGTPAIPGMAAGPAGGLGQGRPSSAKTYALPTISVGEPVRASGKTRARLPAVKTRHLRGLDEINDSSLAESAKIALMMHVGQLPENASNHYIVIPELAADWAKTHAVPDDMKPKKKKKKKKKCDWTHSGGCADKVKATVQDVWDSATEEWREAWKKNTRKLAEAWNEAQECFADHTLKLADIPLRFDLPVNFPLDVERDGKKSGGSGSASGKARGTLDVGLPVQGDFRAEVEFFYIPCLPFAVRPKSVGADGEMTVTADLRARVQADGKFDAEFMIPPGGGPAIPVAVLPIVIAGVPVAILDVSVYFDGSVRVGGEGDLDGRVRLKAPYKNDFDFSCSGRGCKGKMKRVPMPATTTEDVMLKGALYVQPAVYTALQLSLNFEALAGRAGPQPFLYGELRGCAAASGMQNTSGASTGQNFHALAFDLDWGVELRAEALVAGEQVEEFVTEVMRRQHIWFGDIAPGGSTAIIPALSGPAQLGVNSSGAFTLASRPCFPYGSPVEYHVAWAGGAMPGTVASKPSIGGGVMTTKGGGGATSCTLGSGTGSCKVKPGNAGTFALAWPSPGTYTVTATPVRDEHGREYKAERAQFTVNVQ